MADAGIRDPPVYPRGCRRAPGHAAATPVLKEPPRSHSRAGIRYHKSATTNPAGRSVPPFTCVPRAATTLARPLLTRPVSTAHRPPSTSSETLSTIPRTASNSGARPTAASCAATTPSRSPTTSPSPCEKPSPASFSTAGLPFPNHPPGAPPRGAASPDTHSEFPTFPRTSSAIFPRPSTRPGPNTRTHPFLPRPASRRLPNPPSPRLNRPAPRHPRASARRHRRGSRTHSPRLVPRQSPPPQHRLPR